MVWLALDDVEELRCIIVVRQEKASGLNSVPEGKNSGALELLVVPVPELGAARFVIVTECGLLGRELVDPAIGSGTEAVLLLCLKVSP